MPRKTIYIEEALERNEGEDLYKRLVKLPWKEGIKSKNGFTRLAYNLDLESPLGEEILALVKKVLFMMMSKDPELPNYAVFGTYINFYRDGKMYTPNHVHKGTHQLVISLGATRSLLLGKKEMEMQNGDAILFGSTIHGVPRQPQVSEGRISIATFMAPI